MEDNYDHLLVDLMDNASSDDLTGEEYEALHEEALLEEHEEFERKEWERQFGQYGTAPAKPLTQDEINKSADFYRYIVGINDAPDTPDKVILPGLLMEGGITLLVSQTGSGKSIFTYKLSNAIAHGQEFLGHKLELRPVLYLDRENKIQTLKNFKQWLGLDEYSHANPKSQLLVSGLHSPGVPLPSNEHVIAWAKTQDPKPVIILDTLTRFMEDDEDENLVTDVRRFWTRTTALTDLGCAVLVMHHAGKGENTKTYRGSTDITAKVDFHFVLKNKSPNRRNSPRSN
jgi:AAA domain